MSKNLSELSARKGLDKNLFEEMAKPVVNIAQLADKFLVGTSSVKGSISFYDFLKEDNKNKKVYVCNGSACLCAGTQGQLTNQLSQYFQPEEIGHMTCLGRCHENAAFHYQGQNYSALEQQQIDAILSGTNQSELLDSYHVKSIGEAILTAAELSHDQLNLLFKKLFTQDKALILEQLNESGLRGRGGAGFPIGFKIQSAQQIKSDIKFVICNADEGDPGAYSDRFLLEQKPQMVLFGMVVTAYLSGAQTGILYIRAEYPEAITIVQQAIDAYYQSSEFIQMTRKVGFEFKFKIISAQGAYICGEETALINSIEGQRPEVRVRPPFPTQAGLFNKPTVVNNVETLASLYSIIQQGGKHYKNIGTEKSSGTKLISLDSAFNNPGVYEVAMGTPLSEVFETLGGGFKQSVKAVHIGGPLGGIIPVNKINELSIDFESFTAAGFLLGHASVVSIPNNFPMIKYLHHLFQFASYESCGKCFPCRLGTKRGEEMLLAAIKHDKKMDIELFTDLLNTLEQGSLCAHGGGIPLPVRNALQYFSEELEEYFKGEQS